MSARPNVIKPNFRPIKNEELVPLANVYKLYIEGDGELAKYTAEDPGITADWLLAFKGAITDCGLIVPSKSIIKANKDYGINIKIALKGLPKLTKRLDVFLKKTFLPDQPGVYQSFPLVACIEHKNNKNVEGVTDTLTTIINLITTHNAALTAKSYPSSNKTDLEAVLTTLSNLNAQQEAAKQLVPDNTDAAMLKRNKLYTYIQTIVTLKDIVYYEDAQKRHSLAISTLLAGLQ